MADKKSTSREKEIIEAANRVADIYEKLCMFFADNQISPTLAAVACNSIIHNLIKVGAISKDAKDVYLDIQDTTSTLN